MTPSAGGPRGREDVAPRTRARASEIAQRSDGKSADVAPRSARHRGETAPRAPVLRGGEQTAPEVPPSPRSVTEARDAIAATRERMAKTAELLKGRLELEKGRLERRLDIGAKVRDVVAGREALAVVGAFAAGLVWALARRTKRLDSEDVEALRDWTERRHEIMAALDLED